MTNAPRMHTAPARVPIRNRLLMAVMLAVSLVTFGGNQGAVAAPLIPSNDAGGSGSSGTATTLVDHLFEGLINGSEVATASALLAPEAVTHTSYGDFVGQDGFAEYIAIVKRAYPDAVFVVTNIASQGNTMEVSWVMSATRYQLDPTEPMIDVRVEMEGVSYITVDEGLISALSITNESVAVTDVDVAADAGSYEEVLRDSGYIVSSASNADTGGPPPSAIDITHLDPAHGRTRGVETVNVPSSTIDAW